MERLYVLVRKDLKTSSPPVQAAHAVAQFIIEHPHAWNNEYLIILKVHDIEELKIYKNISNATTSEFYEPDLNNELTAVAIATDNITTFKDLRLL